MSRPPTTRFRAPSLLCLTKILRVRTASDSDKDLVGLQLGAPLVAVSTVLPLASSHVAAGSRSRRARHGPAPHAPGSRLTAASAELLRSSAFVGMQAQYEWFTRRRPKHSAGVQSNIKPPATAYR
jgi:hypothetical protein